MKMVIGETKVQVFDALTAQQKKDGKEREFLYEGTYMGLGTIGLGINGVKQGILVACMSDLDTSEGMDDGTTKNFGVSVHGMERVLFLGDDS